MNLRLVSGSADVTRGIGEALGRVAEGPLALLLTGDYGTGKTTFVQGLAKGLGIGGPVRSPSYNILKRFSSGRCALVHADLYRTRGAPDIAELGINELLDCSGILAIEWPGSYLPPIEELPSINISFSFPVGTMPGHELDGSQRSLEFIWKDDVKPAITAVLRALAFR